MIDPHELNNRFEYHAADAAKAGLHSDTRAALRAVASSFNDRLPDCREKSLALTHLEEAMFWANAAIARN